MHKNSIIFKYLLPLTLLIPLNISAQTFTGWDCMPTPPIPFITTSNEVRTVKTPAGVSRNWWCVVSPATSTSGVVWKTQNLIVLNKYYDFNKWTGAFNRVMESENSLLKAKEEMIAATTIPIAGTQDEYEYKNLGYLGCVALVNTPPVIFNPRLTNTLCGAIPTPPVIAIKWIVSPNGTSFTRKTSKVLNGVVQAYGTGTQTVPVGTECNSLLKSYPLGSATKYLPLLVNNPQEITDEVISCIKG